MSQALNLDYLQEQLKKFETELQLAQAHVFRLDGAIQILKQQIQHIEAGIADVPPQTPSVSE